MIAARHPRRTRLAAGVVALGLAVAASACGGDDGGGSAESWCDFVEESDVVDEVFESLTADPAAVEAGLREVETFVERLPSEAPSEIADDVKVLAEGTQMLIDAFEDADFNIADADLTFMGDPELEERLEVAGDNIDDYTVETCGREFGSDDSDGSDSDAGEAGGDDADDGGSDVFDPANGTIREQLVTQFESIGLNTDEASCIADNLDFADPAVQSGDIASMLDLFDECGISMDRLLELSDG